MAQIQQYLDTIRTAESGENVRDAIVQALDKIHGDNPVTVTQRTAKMPQSGDLVINAEGGTAYDQITVHPADGSQGSMTLTELTATENKEYIPDDNEYYSKVTVDVPQLNNDIMEDVFEVTENNVTIYATEEGFDGFSAIHVNISNIPVSGQFTVRFFDESGNLIGTVLVPAYGSAEFTGTYPTSPLGPFTGWNPEPVNVTRNMDCYPKFGQVIIDPTEITDDWTVICQKRGSGYPLGSHKLLAYGATFTPDEIKVLNPSYSGDSVAYNIYMMMYKVGEGEGNSHSSWLSSSVSLSPISYNSNVPWMNQETSGLRNFLNGPFYNHMSDIFKNSITSVQKYSLNEAGVAIPTQDRIWVPNTSEIGTYQTRNDNDQEYDFAGGSWSGTYVNYLNTLDAVSKKYVRDYLNNDRNFVMAFLKGYNGTVYFEQLTSLRDARSGRSVEAMSYYQSSFFNAIRYANSEAFTRFNLGFCL